MSNPHHGTERPDPALLRRFLDEVDGKAVREFPHGRAGPDDDGVLTCAIATDKRHQMIRLQFPKPVTWLGLDRQSARWLARELRDRCEELLLAAPASGPRSPEGDGFKVTDA